MLSKLRAYIGRHHVALLALSVALGGTSYAAITLPRNSVGTTQLKKGAVTAAKVRGNAVTSGKVKNGSLLARDFKSGQLPAGAQGPQGPKGDPGAQGIQGPKGDQGVPGTSTTTFFASARAAGTLLSASPGASITKYGGQTGAYKATFPQDVTNCVAVANIGETTGNSLPPGEATTRTNGRAIPDQVNTVDIITRNSAGTNADLPFNLVVLC